MGSRIGNTYLNWRVYEYQIKGRTVADPVHPNEIDEHTRPASDGREKPGLLYSGEDLLWAIENADSLQELREAIENNREQVEKVPEWED